MFILSSIVIICTMHFLMNDVYGNTVCDSPKLCQDNEINDDYAVCSGFRGCDGAKIGTSVSIYCYGAYGCMNAELLRADVSVYCYGMYSCYNTTQILSGGNVYCDGYYGCKDIITDIQADSFVYCDGDYSCKEDKIASGKLTACNGNYACYNATIDAGEDIICDGDSSCYYGTLESDTNVYCFGKAACRHSTIYANDYVYSYGYYGTTDSNITAKRIYGYGYWSLSNAIMDSAEMDSMNVYIYGYYTGYGSTVICRDNARCVVNCKGTGCYRTDFICYPGAECSIEPKECESAEISISSDGIYCPTLVAQAEEEDSIKLTSYIEQRMIDTDNDPKYRQIKNQFDKDDRAFADRMKHKHSEADIVVDFDEIKKTDNDQQQLFSIEDLDKINMNHVNAVFTGNHAKNNGLMIYTHILAIFIGSFTTFLIMYYYMDNKKCKEEMKKINDIRSTNYYDDYEYEPLN